MAATLPHEIIIYMLLLLPVKTLLRFRSTCKSWLSSIDSQSFIKAHRDLQDKKIFLTSNNLDQQYYPLFSNGEFPFRLVTSLLDHQTDFLYTSKLPERCINGPECIEYISCCHGLVFVVSTDGSMILWNPTTRKHRKIPSYNHIGGPVSRLLYFNPYSGPAYCFAHDSSSDDYKVLRLKSEIKGEKNYVDMYSVNNNSWKTIGLLPGDCEFPSTQDAIMFKGSFHFIYHSIISHNTELPVKQLILSCCLADKKITEVCIPDVEMGCSIRFKNMCVVEQELSVSGFTTHGMNSKFEVWSIKNYGEKCAKPCWNVTISIQLELPPINILGAFDIVSIRLLVERGLLLFKTYDRSFNDKAYLIYDTRKQQYIKIIGFPRCGMAMDFVETLVSP